MRLADLVYVSSASRLLDELELRCLADDAWTRNGACHVTGVLLYGDGSFFQYIEGPPEGLELVYQRILGATTHRGIIELHRGLKSQRDFSQWHMGFSTASASDLRTLTRADWTPRQLAQEPGGGRSVGLTLLASFWQANLSGSVVRPIR